MLGSELIIERSRVDDLDPPEPAAHSMLIRIAGPDPLVPSGVGEICIRGRRGRSSEPLWSGIAQVLPRLTGARIDVAGNVDHTTVPDIIGSLWELHPADSAPEGFSRVVAGVESALLDLVANVAEVPLTELVGGNRDVVVTHLPVNPSAAKAGDVERSNGLAPKIVDVSSLDDALNSLAWLTMAGANEAPIWLDAGGALEATEAAKLIEVLGDRVRAEEIPGQIVLQDLVDDADRTVLADLQAMADGVPALESGEPGVLVMATAASSADVRTLAASGVRAVALNPYVLGGVLAAREVAGVITETGGDIRIGLSVPAGSSGLSLRMAAALASALPHLDYFAVSPQAHAAHPLRVAPMPELGGTAPGGSGRVLQLAPGAEVDLAPCAQHVRRSLREPAVAPRSLTYGTTPANTYDVPPLKQASLPSHLLERAALMRGLSTTRLSVFVFLATHPMLPGPLGFLENKAAWTGAPSHSITGDKQATREILERAGIPVTKGMAFGRGDAEAAAAYARSIDGPVVVKPRAGRKGIGVATELRTDQDVRRAIASLRETTFAKQGFIVERFVSGRDYRVYVMGDQVLSVVLRRPASVVGDGRSTVVDLVLDKNLVRLQNPQMRTLPIVLGDDAMRWLERAGLTPSSVPDEGQIVRLGSAANVSSGGDSIEVLDQTHPSLLELAVRATHAVPGLDHAGIDLIGDHIQGTVGADAAIVEVNGSPVTDLHHFPLFGPARDISAELVLRSCELAGFTPDAPRESLQLRIVAEGRVQQVGYRKWFADIAESYGLVGYIRNLGFDRVEAHVAGPADGVTRLATHAFNGPRAAQVASVTTTPCERVSPIDRFEVAQ